MIRTGQIDGLMAFKWQGRLISVPVCMQTMQGQKIMTSLQMKPCFLCPSVHVKLPLMMNNNHRTALLYEDHYKAGDKVAVLVLLQSTEGDREPTFPNHAAV